MSPAVSPIKLAYYLALLAAAPAFTQTTYTTSQATSASPVAYVYVETTNGNGADLYRAAADGRLTFAGTYLFESTGLMFGSTPSHLFTSGEVSTNAYGPNSINSYAIESNGAIGERVSTIPVYQDASANCDQATIQGGFLDHTGRYLFVNIESGYPRPSCFAWQTYKVSATGQITFLGEVENSDVGAMNTIDSNDKFAYGANGNVAIPCPYSFSAYSRNSDGTLDVNQKFTKSDPKPDPSDSDIKYSPWGVAADPTDHLAALLYPCKSSSSNPLPQLASYTVNQSTGSISSTNTWKDMPATEINSDIPENSLPPVFLRMSASGELVAVAGGGLQIFHFNGAAPITSFSKLLLPGDDISGVEWDQNNHLYALADYGGGLHVYTATPTGISEAPGSPYPGPAYFVSWGGLVVVWK
jgi:hypothetical protein